MQVILYLNEESILEILKCRILLKEEIIDKG